MLHKLTEKQKNEMMKKTIDPILIFFITLMLPQPCIDAYTDYPLLSASKSKFPDHKNGRQSIPASRFLESCSPFA